MAIVFALIAFFAWSWADILAALSSRKVGHTTTFIYSQITALFLSLLFIPFAGPFPPLLPLIFTFFLSLLDSAGTLAFFRSFELGNASLTGTIAGAFGLVSVLIAVFIFHEPMTMLKVVALIFIFLGIVLSSLKISDMHYHGVKTLIADKGIVYALTAMMCWGVYYGFISVAVKEIGWFWAWFPINFTFLVLLPFRSIRKKAKDSLKIGKLYFAILFGIIANVGFLAVNLGVMRGYTSVVVPIAGATPVLFVILSRFIFKDKLTKQQKIGIICSLIGIVILGIS